MMTRRIGHAICRVAFPPTTFPPVQTAPSRPGPPPDPDLIESLTWREAEVVRLLEARLSIEEIATSLGSSSEIVRRHTRTVYQKLMLGKRCAAVARD
jgi:ATP/maltotriose-dependent transcriptional regulator MalT